MPTSATTLYRKHITASKLTPSILADATTSAPQLEPVDAALPVMLACLAVVPEGEVVLVVAPVVDVAAVGETVYRLTSVLLPSTLEPPVLVPRSIVSVPRQMVA